MLVVMRQSLQSTQRSKVINMIRQSLSTSDITGMLNISRFTLKRMIDAGGFPEPLRLTKRTLRWDADAVEAWLQERQACAAQK